MFSPLQSPLRSGSALAAVLLLAAGFLIAQPLAVPLRAKVNTPPAQEVATAAALQEAFSFQLHDLPVRHQGGNTLDVTVRYTYAAGIRDADYPDFRLLAQTCENFLIRYPQESTFWEIVNKELTQSLLDQFPALASVTVEIQVAANPRIPYGRSSVVTRQRGVAPAEK